MIHDVDHSLTFLVADREELEVDLVRWMQDASLSFEDIESVPKRSQFASPPS